MDFWKKKRHKSLDSWRLYVPDWSRTSGLLLRRQSLYPTELQELIYIITVLCNRYNQIIQFWTWTGCHLGGPCYIHLTNETNAAFPWKHSVFRIFVMATFILIISSFEAVNYNYFTFLIFVNTSSIITVSSVCYNRFSYFSEIILLPLFFPWFLFLLVLR